MIISQIFLEVFFMENATYVINVLEDSNRRSIEYENKVWLRNNVDAMDIKVSEQDCNVSVYDIKSLFEEKDIIVIQNGKEIKSKAEFNRKKEALLIMMNLPLMGNMVFQYFP